MKVSLLFTLSVLSLLNLSAAQEPEVFVYKEIDGQTLEVTVFRPEKQDIPTPAIVWYYGSGFNQKEPGQFFEHAKILNSLGIASISTNIRGAIRNEGQRDFRVCIEDAKSAFRWVRAHANDLNLDSKRIAVGGGSSGGFLAAAIATLPGFDASSDDLSIPLDPSLQILFNPGLGNDLPKTLSPYKNIFKGIAPAIIFNGNADTTTPISGAYEYQRSMDSVGAYCEVIKYEGQKHGFFNYRPNNMAYFHKTVGDMLLFLDKQGYLSK